MWSQWQVLVKYINSPHLRENKGMQPAKQNWTHQKDGEKAEKNKDEPKQVRYNGVAPLGEE